MAKIYKSYVWLYKKYVTERKTEQEIADIAGVSQVTIHNWLKMHNLKKKR